MITRGHYIGEIIDSLTEISSKANMRSSLGLTDLNVHLENFFRDILNLIYGYNLVNLNDERSNEPGLDLGDKKVGIAFQITTVKTSQKIKKTLSKITDAQQKKFNKFRVLIIGIKQTSYSINSTVAKKLGFDMEHIIDLDYVCRDIMSLKIDDLQSLYEYIRTNSLKIKIEMDIPNEDGEYPSGIRDFKENIPTPRIGDGKKLLKYLQKNRLDEGANLKTIKLELISFSKKLERLPRISREFYAELLKGREPDEHRGRGNFAPDAFYYNADRLERQFTRFPSVRAETRLLRNDDFLSFDRSNDPDLSDLFTIHIPSESGDLWYWLVNYLDDENLSYQKVLVFLDFGDF